MSRYIETPEETLLKCIDAVYNEAVQQFIIMKAGDSYILGDHFIKYSNGGYGIFHNKKCIYSGITIIESAIALSYSTQVDDISMVLEVKRNIRAYDKHDTDVMVYRQQIETFTSNGDYGKIDHIDSRLTESVSERAYYRNKLKMYCVKQMYKLKAVDKYS